MLHLNVGPSALALGLAVPIALDAGFDVCVICRPDERDAPKVFGLSISGAGGRLEYREVGWWDPAARAPDLPPEVLARIESNEPLLITASLRSAIEDRHVFIAEVLDRRPAGAETVVLACENDPHPDYEKVRESCARTGALMLRTVVNRMCVELEPDEVRSDTRRVVSAHRLHEWLVDRPKGEIQSAVLEALARAEGFALVDDFGARRDRKIWMVNGGHQAVALMARRANADHRMELALQKPENSCEERISEDLRAALRARVLARLGVLHSAMNEALRRVHPDLEGSLEYGLDHVEAYAEHPDNVGRVLSAFKRRDLAPFIETLDTRIATPARICRERGLSVEPFAHVVGVLLELVANIDAFQDNEDIRRNGLGECDDALPLAAFRRLITPWVGADEVVEKLCAHFEQLLADHREAFGD